MAQTTSSIAPETIFFYNSSFEGNKGTSVLPPYWKNCVKTQTPDIQPGSFGVGLVPFSGNTYLSMVANDNGTVESFRQVFFRPMQAGTCYRMSVYLAKSEKYLGQSQKKGQLENFIKPLKLVITGLMADSCEGLEEDWLVETLPVHHNNWKKYTFFINPPKPYVGLIFRVAHAADTLYNGNLLIDNLSPIIPVECADLKVMRYNNPSLKTTLSLMHTLNEAIIENGKKMVFEKKKAGLVASEDGRNIYYDNILQLFERYPNYRLILRVKNNSGLGKDRMVYLYNYIFKNSQLKAQQVDIQRFKAKDEQYVWSIENDDIAISFDTN